MSELSKIQQAQRITPALDNRHANKEKKKTRKIKPEPEEKPRQNSPEHKVDEYI
ncbi:MAG: hypothetical protein GKR93_10725 [Gammaproteobacteria bacterium]|nr:hypothetical protein [Gammaproteobacteria bacterium]